MPNPIILKFLEKRKEDWLKAKISRQMNEEQMKEVELTAEKRFSLNDWLPDASKRAKQIQFTTHPCTLSHPSARKNKNGYVTSVVAKKQHKIDGFLRTGNVQTDLDIDALGNAAALDVYAFVNLKMEDGKTLIEHIEKETSLAKQLLTIPTESYENLKKGFLEMKSTSGKQQITSSKIKQVYFPVDDENYHLLSILTSSQNIYEMRNRINEIRFSEENKEIREKRAKNLYSPKGYKEIKNLTEIRYGGANPQNISVLNTTYQGRAFLLPSIPPTIQKREVTFPRRNFFYDSIKSYHIKDSLERLDKLIKLDSSLAIPKSRFEKARNSCFEDILDQVIYRMDKVREASSEQYFEKTSLLPTYQKIWLLDFNKEKRELETAWFEELVVNFSLWIVTAYSRLVKKPQMFGPVERKFIENFIAENMEVLK